MAAQLSAAVFPVPRADALFAQKLDSVQPIIARACDGI